MKSVEEKLWEYIDGACSAGEQKIIAELIAADAGIRAKYEELLALNKEFAAMELDEPPMAFTYKVMEGVRNQNAGIPLKAAINKNIIRGIAIFFVVTLLASLVFVFTNVKFSAQSAANLSGYFKMPAIDAGKARLLVQCFVFCDVILALYLFDAYLRRKRREKTVGIPKP